MKATLLSLLGGVMVISACANGTTPEVAADQTDDSARQAIADASRAYSDAWRNSDAAAAAAFLSENAVISSPGQPDLRGRAAAEENWRQMLSTSKVTSLEIRREPLVLSGDLAIDAGEYDETIEVQGQTSSVMLQGRYVIVWQRQADGVWKILRFIAVDRPAVAPPSD